jgi:hypothetical protein
MIRLTDLQTRQLNRKGISLAELSRQLERFVTGMQYVDLDRPATPGDGVIVCDEMQKEHLIALFDREVKHHDLIRFVPASGAASRMFKDLFEFLEMHIDIETTYDNLSRGIREFAFNLGKMPFADTLFKIAGVEKMTTPDPLELQSLIRVLLLGDGMRYGSLPKALIIFHHYGDHVRLAFEEHLVEWGTMLGGSAEELKIHFTLSPDHISLFNEVLSHKLPLYRNRFGIDYDITHSVQADSTDTVAATEDNQPYTDRNGELLFRPGGHGALLYNLNRLDADFIIIKNIDNVAIEKVESLNVQWKKVLTGLLMETKTRINKILLDMDAGNITTDEVGEISEWILSVFNHQINIHSDQIQDEIKSFLNRPVRVCGMVKNTGEPGGGPFWVRKGEKETLQIIESAQIDHQNPQQHQIAMEATHFNPVDLVCAVKDYRGNKFDLNLFSDPDTSFISVKSHQGKVLKALEHPGLWNGAMADWLTLFVEVPLITFNPVKTVNDLLRPEHQNK